MNNPDRSGYIYESSRQAKLKPTLPLSRAITWPLAVIVCWLPILFILWIVL
jgi:hypothetical protein